MGAPPTAGLVRLDQVDAHPHNIRRNLGELRPMAASIARRGLLQPIVVERHGSRLRLRAGHRRAAAARLAGLTRVPAIIHAEALDDEEWLIDSVMENEMRAGLDTEERRRTIAELTRHGCSREGIGEIFGVSAATITRWAADPKDPDGSAAKKQAQAQRRISPSALRSHVADFRSRGLSREEILAELEAIAGPPPDPGAGKRKSAAARQAAFEARHQSKIDKVRLMHESGSGRAEICKELGTTTVALARFLARRGEHELGRVFYGPARSGRD